MAASTELIPGRSRHTASSSDASRTSLAWHLAVRPTLPAPWPASGPTPAPTPPKPNAAPPLTPGCTSTTITGDTALKGLAPASRVPNLSGQNT
jgi:hypothetical protein